MKELDARRIIIMSKMAIYDKTYGTEDKKANDLFYRDYVYRRNFIFRTCALIGTLIPIGISTVFLAISEDMDFLTFDYLGFLQNHAITIAIVMALYTFIGTKVATAEYKNIKIRLQAYFALMRELDEITHGKEASDAMYADDEDDEEDDYYQRNNFDLPTQHSLSQDSYKSDLRKKYANTLRD